MFVPKEDIIEKVHQDIELAKLSLAAANNNSPTDEDIIKFLEDGNASVEGVAAD